MAVYSPVRVTNAGITESLTAVGSSDTFTYPSGTVVVWMVVNNADAANNQVTVTSRADAADGEFAANKSVVVGNGSIGVFRIGEAFIDGSGVVTVAHSNTTSNTAGVFYI